MLNRVIFCKYDTYVFEFCALYADFLSWLTTMQVNNLQFNRKIDFASANPHKD